MKGKTFIFDIGGVVLTHAKTITPTLLAKIYDVPLELTEKVYIANRDEWRTGKVSGYQYLSRMRSQFGSRWSVAELIELYRDAYMQIAGIDPEIINLIQMLKKKYTVVALSNTVDMHYEINKERGLFDNFHHAYMSFQIGYIKPDPKAYLHVLQDIGATFEEAYFIDDKAENIEGAGKLGLQTHHYVNSQALINDLKQKKYL